ncbi:hypothetical protein AcV7_001948 [Taiwanofungus camphoratus]|nr:hypothetical protein AcV7_001948 [Antrodia cinnamomea]
MSSAIDIWGVVAGVLGTLGLIPMVLAMVQSQFPSTRLKVLDDTLTETTSLFRTVSEEGLLKDVDYVSQTRDRLSFMCRQAEEFRTATHCATTTLKEFKELLKGLSRKISLLCEEVKELRASISTTSSKERERLLNGGGVLQHSPVTTNIGLFGAMNTAYRSALSHDEGTAYPALMRHEVNSQYTPSALENSRCVTHGLFTNHIAKGATAGPSRLPALFTDSFSKPSHNATVSLDMATSMKPDCCCQSSSDSTTIVMDESKLGQQMLASPELTSDMTQHNVISTKTGYYTNSSVVSPKDIGGSPNVNDPFVFNRQNIVAPAS